MSSFSRQAIESKEVFYCERVFREATPRMTCEDSSSFFKGLCRKQKGASQRRQGRKAARSVSTMLAWRIGAECRGLGVHLHSGGIQLREDEESAAEFGWFRLSEGEVCPHAGKAAKKGPAVTSAYTLERRSRRCLYQIRHNTGREFPKNQAFFSSLLKKPPQQNLWVDSGSGSRPRL